jgi:hypothetical protein
MYYYYYYINVHIHIILLDQKQTLLTRSWEPRIKIERDDVTAYGRKFVDQLKHIVFNNKSSQNT